MKKTNEPLELSLEEIREFKKRLELDDFELQLLMHRIRTPLETLKKRYKHARSNMGRLLIKTAIKYKEEKVMRNDN
jgi:hypothetical protein